MLLQMSCGARSSCGCSVNTGVGPTYNEVAAYRPFTSATERIANRVPQGSVQIELIFRLLLKITVDWPYNAINKCL